MERGISMRSRLKCWSTEIGIETGRIGHVVAVRAARDGAEIRRGVAVADAERVEIVDDAAAAAYHLGRLVEEGRRARSGPSGPLTIPGGKRHSPKGRASTAKGAFNHEATEREKMWSFYRDAINLGTQSRTPEGLAIAENARSALSSATKNLKLKVKAEFRATQGIAAKKWPKLSYAAFGKRAGMTG